MLEKTYKNSKVTKINYNRSYDTVKISTADGKEYLADHVIFTPSLGVLKANYQRLFNPPLPEKKVTAIKVIKLIIHCIKQMKFIFMLINK